VDLVESLAALTTDEGLAVALVVGRDGLLIEGRSRTGDLDLESIAALATRTLPELDRLSRLIGGGALAQLRVRFDRYALLIELLSASDVLVAGVESAAGSERLLDAVARQRPLLQQALSNL
jgi:predicted regulator of Ras-like GTPase activity (Roadblock/LC7/MglB family)